MTKFRTRKSGQHYPISKSRSATTYSKGTVHLTPPKKWYNPKIHLNGWHSYNSEESRHAAINRSIKTNGLLKTWQALLALHNVSKNPKVKAAAKADYEWMSKEHAEGLHQSREQHISLLDKIKGVLND